MSPYGLIGVYALLKNAVLRHEVAALFGHLRLKPFILEKERPESPSSAPPDVLGVAGDLRRRRREGGAIPPPAVSRMLSRTRSPTEIW